MNLKTIIAIIAVLYATISISQETQKTFEVGVNTNLFFTGDYNAIYAISSGVEGQYFFAHKGKFHHFVNVGFTAEIGTVGANLYLFDTGIGTQYDLVKLFKRSLFLEASIGGLYSREQIATQLINNTIESTFNEFGFKAKFGVGYPVLKNLALKLNLTQFNSSGTAWGAGISYSF